MKLAHERKGAEEMRRPLLRCTSACECIVRTLAFCRFHGRICRMHCLPLSIAHDVD